MKTKNHNNKKSPINVILTIINIVLILILVVVIVLDSEKKPIIQNNTINNSVLNEINETNNITNKINNTANPTNTPPVQNTEVAKIKDKIFESLQEAIDYIEAEPSTSPGGRPKVTPTEQEPTEIILLKDITSNFTVGADKNIILNMDNHIITNAGDKPIATIDGKLELKDGQMVGKYTRQQVYAVKVNESGNLSCSNMNFNLSTSEAGWIISNDGTLSLESSKLNYQKGTAINNSGTIEQISGDSYLESNGNYIALYNLGTINKITGGEILSNSYAIYNTGTIEEISGDSKVTSRLSYALYNSGNVGTIKDNVKIDSSAVDVATIYNNGGKMKKVTGNVNINSEKNRAIYNMGVIDEISGNVTINSNGDVTVSTIYNSNPGEITITGGTITQKNDGYGVYREGGIVTITGGNVSSKYNC